MTESGSFPTDSVHHKAIFGRRIYLITQKCACTLTVYFRRRTPPPSLSGRRRGTAASSSVDSHESVSSRMRPAKYIKSNAFPPIASVTNSLLNDLVFASLSLFILVVSCIQPGKMSVVPLLFRDWWDDYEFSRPSRLLDQQFGLGLNRDELLNSFGIRPSRYLRPWRNSTITRQDSGSTIAADKEKFQVILDVQQFAPNEITVKTVNNSIVVEGKHEEKQDEHGYISRHFVRRYILPSDNDINEVVSTLSSDGVLTVTAPKKSLKPTSSERVVPITQTGPAKPTVTPVADSPQPRIEHPN